MTHSFPPRRSSDLGISTAGISAARIGRPHGTARLVAGDDRIEAVGLARIKELVSRQGHPVLLARGPELGHRLQPAGVVERAGLQHHDLGKDRKTVIEAGVASGAEEAVDLAPAPRAAGGRSEEHTSEIQLLNRLSFYVFLL